MLVLEHRLRASYRQYYLIPGTIHRHASFTAGVHEIGDGRSTSVHQSWYNLISRSDVVQLVFRREILAQHTAQNVRITNKNEAVT